MSAVLLAAAYPPLPLAPVVFVGLAPLAVWVARLHPGPSGRDAALRGGLLFGALHFGLVFHWMPLALVRHSLLALPAWIATVAVLAAVAAGVTVALHRMVHRGGVGVAVALPLAWTAGEWLRAHLPGSLAVPWLGLGTALAGAPGLAQSAEWVGVRGLTLWIAGVNGLVAAAWLAAGTPRAGRRWAAAGALLAVPAAAGAWRAATLEVRPAARVAVVQPAIPAADRTRADAPAEALATTRAALARLAPGVRADLPDLVVLPEAVFPVRVGPGAGRAAVGWLEAWSGRVGAPVMFGAFGVGPAPDPPGRPDGARPDPDGSRSPDAAPADALHNSVFLAGPGGLTPWRYDKRHLVPGVERLPLLPSAGRRFVAPGRRGFDPGRAWTVARVAGVGYGALVCYESSFPGAARRLRLAGADVLVNLTNDGWFAGRAPTTATAAAWQHPAHLVLRAIENRVGVARAANTGISLFVDPLGRVHDATAWGREAAVTASVTTTDATTLFTASGDVAGPGAALAALTLVLAAGGLGGRLPRVGGGAGRRPEA